MKITIERRGGGPVRFSDFAASKGLDVLVTERDRSAHSRYYARFPNVEIVERGCLSSVVGDGKTPEEAIANYAQRLLGERIVVDAYRPEPRVRRPERVAT